MRYSSGGMTHPELMNALAVRYCNTESTSDAHRMRAKPRHFNSTKHCCLVNQT